ncbi:glycosyltransferase family 2 protein, partial [Bacteroidales bacterium OttesenSCG-928-I21]|nr:glycosyltransferase family 2 protein [Bacteroidales bacterium OttesenSCG-928-I21]
AEGIESFYTTLSSVLNSLQISYEIIFVNDGSTDATLTILKKISEQDRNIKIINFSQNFGHEAAMIAGIDYSSGESVICMDSDLQHPPTMISEMLKKKEEGFDVVNMVRTERKDAGFVQKMNSKLFYKFINKISSVKLAENASDFFLISKRVANILRADFRERTRFLRGIIQIVGFNKTNLEYIAEERFAGKSKYSFFKLLVLSFTAISSFSKFPLQLGIITGLIFGLISIALIIYSIIMWILDTPVSGYTTLIVFLSAFAGIQLFVTGIIGQYLSYIFDETKRRPIYIVEDAFNFENEKKL